MLHIIWSIIIGFIAGAIASMIMPHPLLILRFHGPPRNYRVDRRGDNRPSLFETAGRFLISSSRFDLIDHRGDYRALHRGQDGLDRGGNSAPEPESDNQSGEKSGLLGVRPSAISPAGEPPFFVSLNGSVGDMLAQHLVRRTAKFQTGRPLFHFFENL